jgi:hypothetical protein
MTEEHPTQQIKDLAKTVKDHGDTLIKINDTLISMDEKLKALEPIKDNYKTAVTLGKWFMGLLIFLGALIGVLVEFKKLFK